MRIFLIMILFICANNLFAQKPVIDSVAYKQWASLEGPTVSNNGEYVFYTIENLPVGNRTLVLQSTDGKWKREFKGGLKDYATKFSDKYFLFITKNDSLGRLKLGTDEINYVSKVAYCNFYETKEGECIAYTSGQNSKTLNLKNLKSNKEQSFTDVDSWSFDNDVLVLIKSILGSDQMQSINLADMVTGKLSKIWEGHKPENLILDGKHRQLAFKTGDSVWYYKFDSASAVCISGKEALRVDTGLTLGYLDSFSKDGEFLFTSLIGKVEAIKPKNGVVEIWSYADVRLQTEQENGIVDQKYVAVIDVKNHRLVSLQQQQGEWFQFSKSEDDMAKVALVENPSIGNPWSTAYKCSWDLVTLKNGHRMHLDFLDGVQSGGARLSPCGKYIMYFDKVKQGYCSYEISTATLRNLTKGINVLWMDINQDDRPTSGGGRGVATWLKNDQSVLVYDRYDIWKLDPLDIEKPINLTNGYGKRNQIVFNYAFEFDEGKIVNKNERLYLTAFNKENKNNGFFLKQLDKAGDPELLHMGPYLYQTNSEFVPNGSDFSTMKATKSEMYVVRRMSATDAPNYFSTKDFKTFIRLSDLQPHKKYNWYTTELHTWKSLNGRKLQGILYKPENFDPNKKYPVIFHYYERKSDGLNAYMKPEALCGMCNIDIPSYVSRGYLVFTPDIYYKIGEPLQGTYDAIVSAANYVSTLSFVNTRKMGIQGCSWGAVQTNYLVTHTDIFAAAVSSSGISDLVSHYGGLFDDKSGIAFSDRYHEGGQFRIGASLWEKPEAYIKSSPIFQVDKITTPLLIMQGKKDPGALFSNTLEFYLGLRRMGKKAWMLAYPEGGHGLGGNDAIDFSTRMMQFFDHYLKDKPAPLWMLDGVPAENRSWNAGLELDTKGRTPGPGLLTPEELAKVESMMTRKPITITLK